MKFISVVAILLMISALAVGQSAPAQTSTTIRDVAITNTPSDSSQAMYRQLLRRLPWQGRQGQRSGGCGSLNVADGFNDFGTEKRLGNTRPRM